MKVEEQYVDVLQNIESGIVSTYRRFPELVDHDVARTLEAVMDSYKAEKIGRPPREFSLSQAERVLFDAVRRMCEWRLGRCPLVVDSSGVEEAGVHPTPKTVDEILLCLKRLIKSVKTWNRQLGRQGYLNFIIQYVR